MQELSEKDARLYRFDDITVDPADFLVTKAGRRIKLTPRAFEVLSYLVKNHGRTIEKQELFENIWRENFVSDNALTRVIREIRQAIGDEAAAPRYIETVPKRGYRFIAEVEITENKNFEKAVDETANGRPEKFPAADAGSGRPEKARPRWPVPAFAAGVFLLAAFVLFRQFWSAPPAPDFPSQVAFTTQLTNWSGLDNFPAISPDGNLIAYSSDRSGSFEIYVKQLAPGAKEIRLTSDGGQNLQPAFSPDGRFIAFYSKTRGGIWIVPSSGGTAKRLTDFGSHPAFSPDGGQIAFQSDGLTDLGVNARTLPPSVLWIVSSAGGEQPRQLTRLGSPPGGHGAPAFSPDGKRVAFNAADMNSVSIWSVEVESGRVQRIIARSSDPVYAPDGRSIYYTGWNGLWQIPVSPESGEVSGEARQIADDGPAHIRHPGISADGKKLVYEMLMSESALFETAFGENAAEPAALLRNTSSRNTFPVFSPDGRQIAYISGRPGAHSELWLMKADGKDAAATAGILTSPSWLPDGRSVAGISREGETARLVSLDLTGGNEKTLFTFNGEVQYARLSPDGRQVAFNSKEDGPINVWIGDLESGAARQLTFDGEFAGFPVWSPDGKWIALQLKRGDDTHIALLPSAGGEMTRLTGERGQSWIHSFSPDGENIVFAGQRDDVWNIYSINRLTGEKKKLTNFNRLNSYVRYPTWSPLGDKIVFEYAETTGNIWLTELK
jgi:Tol biopolymer transport system component/DNA-binding winged helix-turn-helix (wHTH) protein